ncbi:MAG: NADH-dependent [FeFe] hydrogenase, group A6 [Eubacteriales bacterium]
MINLTINGKKVQAPDGCTIMEAAKVNGIKIPSLCHLEGVHSIGSCRICVVEVEGAKTLQASCITKAREGMVISTNSKTVRDARRVLYELILSDHSQDCLSCNRNQSCELQELGRTLGVEQIRFTGAKARSDTDISFSITRDNSKCILCRRCVTVCNEVQSAGVIFPQNRGFDTIIGPAMDLPLGSTSCAFCGQCTVVCPVGALKETDSIQQVWDALHDPGKRVVVQVAPAIRVAIGEEFGLKPGTRCTGKLASALEVLGFDDIFDTNWAADLTIMEEGTELLGRLKKKLAGEDAVLPMITSCSPGWIKFVENTFPDELDHLSTCKSPHTMMGAVIKSYYADKIGVDPKNIYVVSIMPCTAKKTEIVRKEMQNGGLPNVDAVLTTRELGEMIREAGIDFVNLPDRDFDTPLGMSSGAADIFGVTGGVMEAALRTVYEIVTGQEMPFEKLHVEPIVGLQGIKEATIKIESTLPEYSDFEGVELRIAVSNGLKNARALVDQIAQDTSPYHFIEIMGCPGGCINGGGQPRSSDPDVREKRLKALYDEDESKVIRKSHENPAIQAIYREFLGTPNSEKSHQLLHTSYTRRGIFNELTDESFIIEPKKPSRKTHVPVSPLAVQITRREVTETAKKEPTVDPARLLALESENNKLRREVEEAQETVRLLKGVIATYSKRKK